MASLYISTLNPGGGGGGGGGGITATGTPVSGQVAVFDSASSVVGDTGLTYVSGQLLLGGGSNAVPSYSFDSDPNTGIYSAGANQIGFAANGTNRCTVSETSFTSVVSIVGPAGSAATPSFAFSGDLNTGIYTSSADTLAVSTGGTNRITVNATNTTITSNILGPSGSATTPGYSINGDPDTGMYSSGANLLAFATAGVKALELNASQQLLATYGATATPAYAFASDPDTGIYGALNTVGITTSGVKRATIDTTQLATWVPVRASGGSTAVPEYSFASDSNTGFFWNGADGCGITTGGVVRVQFANTYTGFNLEGNDVNFRVDGDTSTSLLCVDAGLNSVGINQGTPAAKLHVSQTSTTAAIPVLELEQDDIDQAFIEFDAASAASVANPITTWTAGNSIQGFVRVTINGTARWVPFYDAPTS